MRERLRLLVDLSRSNPVLVPWDCVREYRGRYRNEIYRAKRLAHDAYITNSTNPQSAMWKIIKSQKPSATGHGGTPECLTAEQFNNYFSSIADEILNNLPAARSSFTDFIKKTVHNLSFTFHSVSYSEVRDIMSDLSNSSSKDCFELNTRILKALKNVIVYPLTKLINLAIASRTFPQVLKTARVIPVFKNKGSPEDVTNYRPISLLPVLSKVFESVLKSQILHYFENNGLFYQKQFGFRPKKNTTLAVECLGDFIRAGFENGLDTFASCLDLTKAFDCVSHDILIEKLSFYNFDYSSTSLLKSYLSDREQYVCCNGAESGKRLVRHGVPQGSVLGPVLFLIYVNDLPNSLSDKNVILFADDTTIYESFHPKSLSSNTISNNLGNIESWFLSNKLSINTFKTQNITFSLRHGNPDHQLFSNCLNVVCLLGVHLDRGLTWEAHVVNLSKKLCRSIYLIRNLSRCVSSKTLLSAYHGYFGSNISYAVLEWGHSCHSRVVFGLQRRCVRVMAGLGYREDCRRHFVLLCILTFLCVYILHCLLHVKRNLGRFMTHSGTHNYETRNRNNLIPDYVRLDQTRCGTNHYGILLFNKLPQDFRELDLDTFRVNIKTFLLVNAFYSIEEFLESNLANIM